MQNSESAHERLGSFFFSGDCDSERDDEPEREGTSKICGCWAVYVTTDMSKAHEPMSCMCMYMYTRL